MSGRSCLIVVFVIFAIVFVGAHSASAQVFLLSDLSVDPLSPEVPAPYSPADAVNAHLSGGGAITFPSAALGLPAAGNIDAMARGYDDLPITFLNPNLWTVHYSVTRPTVGAGGIVTAEAVTDGAAGDLFVVTILGPAPLPPVLDDDAITHFLTPLPAQSDLDAYTGTVGAPPVRVFFSVDPPTAVGLSVLPADILVTIGPPAAFAVYATPAVLGLLPGDDINALAIRDGGTLGTFDGADVIYLSLAPGSPTLGAIGATASQILTVSAVGPPGILPLPLDLLPTDDLNALAVFDPGARCDWYCGSGANAATDGFVILSPPVLGGFFGAAVTGCASGNVGAFLAAYLTPLSLMSAWGEILVNIADPGGELLGLPFRPGNPAVIMLPVPNLLSLVGFRFYTQAGSLGGSICLHCAYECTVGF